MENASKALIIAGAILIAIVLIGLGVMVIRNANAPLEQAQDVTKSQAVEMFNSKFTGYAGSQSAASIKALITAIQSNNGVSNHDVTLNTASTAGTSLEAIQASVSNQRTYTVTFTYNATGYISSVTINR